MDNASVAEDQLAEDTSAKPRSRLVRKYTLLISLLVSGALILSGAVEVDFSYQETKSAQLRIQREKAAAAAYCSTRSGAAPIAARYDACQGTPGGSSCLRDQNHENGGDGNDKQQPNECRIYFKNAGYVQT